MRTMKEKMHTGEIYLPGDEEILEVQFQWLDRLYDYNMTRPTEGGKRQAMLKEMFAEIGENCYIEPPLHANQGGAFVHFGKNIYANFNLTLVDDTHIYVGDYTMFGPNVTLAIRSFLHCAAPMVINIICLCISERIVGLEQASSYCRALRSATTQ